MHFELRDRAHRGYISSYRAHLDAGFIDPQETMSRAKPLIHRILTNTNIVRQKILICFSILFVKLFGEADEHRATFYFCSRCEQVLSNFFISEAIDNCYRKILEGIDNFIRDGSGWSILRIEFIDLHVGEVYREIVGGCSNVQLPSELKKKKCIVSINCCDSKCFLHCVCTKLFAKKKFRNNVKTKYFNRLNTSKLTFPVALNQIEPFAKQNNLTINVYGYTRKQVYPMIMMRRDAKFKKDIDLLLHNEHFFLISNFNRLLSSKNKSCYYCKLCLNGFSRKKTLNKHIKLCSRNKPQKTSLPKECIVKFKNLSKSLRHCFVIYSDFESLTAKIHSATPSSESSFTQHIEMHKPISYALIALNVKSEIIFHEYYVGENAVEHFLDTLKFVTEKLIAKMKVIIPMKEGGNYNPNSCVLCGKSFAQNDVKTRHHEHFLGKGEIVGLAHQSCNLNYRSRYFIPIFIHNLRGYDSHLILKHMPANYAKRVQIVPTNMQKFISFSFDHMRFLDSYQFLDASLEVLTKNLTKTNCQFRILKSFYGDRADLLKRKGVFPYGYFDSPNVLKDKFLPPIEAFENILTGECISEDDYAFAKNVYDTFQCSSFSEYLELYQNADVLLLAEVFESFRKMSLEHYKLDPVHYYTLSQLTFDAGLKYANIEIQLLGDVDQYIWLESQMRGGLCLVNKRYQKANNELVGYKPKLPKNYILPLDAINLYGAILCLPLPLCNFCWLTPEEIANFDILKTSADSDVGYILESDIDYPDSLMDSQDDFPLVPDHLTITYEHLSPYGKSMCDKLNLRGLYPCRKLVPNFFAKRNYIAHYLNLKFYVEKGLIIRKIHRIMSFTQKPYLKEYILFNNAKRNESDNAFEKAFFKKLNNAFFGKTMENPRKKLNVRAAFSGDRCQKLLRNPQLEYFEIINPNFTIYKVRKSNLVLDKPIFVGFSVLELSKLHMYRLYYDNFKRVYNERCSLIYCDTDSLYLNIETNDLFSDLATYFKNVMDFSNFPEDHVLHDVGNKGSLGCLKFEYTDAVKCFLALKPKMYSILTEKDCKKRAKGIRAKILNSIDFDAYKRVLFEETAIRHAQVSLASKKHVLYTVLENRTSLSSYHDKKYLLNKIDSVCYGHYSIRDEMCDE